MGVDANVVTFERVKEELRNGKGLTSALEMLKHQFIMVNQPECFGTINIKVNPEWDMKEITDEQFDEYN